MKNGSGRDHSLNASYLERKLRAIGLVGSSPLQDLADVQGLVNLESDRPEWLLAGGEELYSRLMFNGTIAVGQASAVGLANPADSGWIAIIERLWARCDPAGAALGTISINWSSFLGFSAQGKVPRDGRRGTININGGVQAVAATDTTANLGLNALDMFNPEVESYQKPIIVPPNSRILLIGVDNAGAYRTNVALFATLAWRVRPVEGTFEMR